jgi:predicted DCC family thiol-disulfide oxidoreductase YuxK
MTSNLPLIPLLIYDGDCSFCRLWIDRWRVLTGDRVAYAPFQQVADQFPDIPRERFAQSVQLILPDGETFSGAHAVFRTLTYAPGMGWMLALYLQLPGLRILCEWGYRLVARHRSFSYKLTRLLWGNHFERPSHSLSRWLFFRLLGMTYLAAFFSLSTQITGLLGSNGILPASDFLKLIQSNFGLEQYWFFPTLAWVNASDGFLRFLTLGGATLSLAVILGIATLPALIILWIFYLSIVTVGRDFMSFQWDALLLEAGFLAIFSAPSQLWPGVRKATAPSTTLRPSQHGERNRTAFLWLFRLLLFRLIFSSGAVKLLSRDPTWRHLTALEFHYETQPLPTPVAWYMHLLPARFQEASVVFVFFVELLIPFLIFAPRRLRFVAGGFLVFLQALIALTGNYCFFNLLTIALCVLLFDDASLSRLFPRFLADRILAGTGQARKRSPWRWLVAPVALIVLIAGILQIADLFARRNLPRPALRLLRIVQPLYLVNSYGLFAVMTTTRPEIIIQGSNDGENWLPYEFKYKPGDLTRAPTWVEPFQPRLDWQMWFAALGSYQGDPWFVNFVFRLLQGSPQVLRLLASNPFPRAPPRYIRALLYDYHFTDWATKRAEGRWWSRELRGIYLPVATLSETEERGRDQ